MLSLLPHQLSAVTHFGTQGKHSPVCRASSSPPPHLLTETRLLLFLTLQLPLAWGSPLYPHPLAPTRWHQSVILRALLQPEGPGGRSGCPGRAGLWGKQNKSVTAQSPEFPHPDSFRTCTSQDCPTPSYHPSRGLQKGNRTSGLRSTVGKRMGSSSAGSEAEGKSNGSSLVSSSF